MDNREKDGNRCRELRQIKREIDITIARAVDERNRQRTLVSQLRNEVAPLRSRLFALEKAQEAGAAQTIAQATAGTTSTAVGRGAAAARAGRAASGAVIAAEVGIAIELANLRPRIRELDARLPAAEIAVDHQRSRIRDFQARLASVGSEMNRLRCASN